MMVTTSKSASCSNKASCCIAKLEDKWGIGIFLSNLAMIRLIQKQHAEATAVGAEGLLLCQELADRRGAAWCLECLAATEAAQARFVRAVRLWGAAEALLEGIGSQLPFEFTNWIHDPYLKVTRESLDERTFKGAWSQGRAMPLKEAVRYALEDESV